MNVFTLITDRGPILVSSESFKEAVRLANIDGFMVKEFTILTDYGPMLISSKSLEEAIKLANTDGFTVKGVILVPETKEARMGRILELLKWISRHSHIGVDGMPSEGVFDDHVVRTTELLYAIRRIWNLNNNQVAQTMTQGVKESLDGIGYTLNQPEVENRILRWLVDHPME